MKTHSVFLRSLIALAASASSPFAIATSANAQAAPAGTTGQVGILTPSTQTFVLGTSGANSPSTIQYNGSQGQNNNFAVGTSTSFGVSASASSTPDYSVASKATLGAEAGTGGTVFTNQIGSSGAASAANSYAESASAAASRSVDYRASQAFAADSTAQVGYAAAADKVAFKAGWENTWKMSATGQQAYKDAFSSAFSSISQGSSSSTDANGTISGNFVSTQTGSGNVGTSSNQNSSSASKLYVQEGSSYRLATVDDYKAKVGGAAVTLVNRSEASSVGTYNYTAADSSQIAAAATSAMAAAATSTTSNSVTVKGIGADATFKSSSLTKFDSDIQTNLGKIAQTGTLILSGGSSGQISSSATANGSANGNFGTNSTASSNSATYSSVFYQAF